MPAEDAKQAMQELAGERAAAALVPQTDLLEDLVGLPANRQVEQIRRAKAGRPPNARNKRSEDVARYVVERIGDPLLMLAQLAMLPADELAAAAGCSKQEAIVEKRLAAIAVLPFLHRRMPLAIETNNRVVHLHFGSPAPAPGAEGGAPTVIGQLLDIVKNQEDSDGVDAQV